MSVDPIPLGGVDRFVADLEAEGHVPTVHGNVVRYYVVPVAGAFAGQQVQTGVSSSELQGWPTAPPHWIHLQNQVTFQSTNIDNQDCPDGWRRHSRDIGTWDMSQKPIHRWMAHVRGVVGQAI